MILTPTALEGAWLIDPERREDFRGFFARTWCQEEIARHGLDPRILQCSISYSKRRGTLRGLHYQVAPFQEVKVIRCTRGAIHDVIVDLRPDSPTFTRHVAAELSAENRRMLYVPRGVAHGFQTLEDDTEVLYQMSHVYRPEAARGVRWNDPRFGIAWPLSRPILLDRDARYPDFTG